MSWAVAAAAARAGAAEVLEAGRGLSTVPADSTPATAASTGSSLAPRRRHTPGAARASPAVEAMADSDSSSAALGHGPLNGSIRPGSNPALDFRDFRVAIDSQQVYRTARLEVRDCASKVMVPAAILLPFTQVDMLARVE